jgi:hypothetical protein
MHKEPPPPGQASTVRQRVCGWGYERAGGMVQRTADGTFPLLAIVKICGHAAVNEVRENLRLTQESELWPQLLMT